MAALTLEVHLTVDGCGPQRLAEVLAEVHPAATVTHVELDDSGEHAQLMATWHQPAPLGDALRTGEQLAAHLAARGIINRRLKVETDIEAADPAGNPEAAAADSGHYLEHHVLVAVTDERRAALEAIATRHQARVSQRARRREGPVAERFVNQRWWQPADAAGAADAFAALLAALRADGFTVLKATAERVLHDTNLALDGDWLGPTPGPAGPAEGHPTPHEERR